MTFEQREPVQFVDPVVYIMRVPGTVYKQLGMGRQKNAFGRSQASAVVKYFYAILLRYSIDILCVKWNSGLATSVVLVKFFFTINNFATIK